MKFSGESLCVLLMEYVPLTGIQFVRALLREHASVDNRMMLSNFMAQLVELIAEFHDKHGFLLKDVSLCNVGLRSLQESTVLLLDLDRFEKKANADTALRNQKRMYTIPAEVAKIALEANSSRGGKVVARRRWATSHNSGLARLLRPVF